MISLQIEIDEETDRILTDLAASYEGDRSKAVANLIRRHEITEEYMDAVEEFHRDSLVMQKERSERDFREGNVTTWEEVKRRNGL